MEFFFKIYKIRSILLKFSNIKIFMFSFYTIVTINNTGIFKYLKKKREKIIIPMSSHLREINIKKNLL